MNLIKTPSKELPNNIIAQYSGHSDSLLCISAVTDTEVIKVQKYMQSVSLDFNSMISSENILQHGTYILQDHIEFHWSSPNELICISKEYNQIKFLEVIKQQFNDETLIITDVSDSYCIFEISGLLATEFMMIDCELDLSAENFNHQYSTVTKMYGLTVRISKASQKYYLFFDVSYQHYIRNRLFDSSKEFNYYQPKSNYEQF